ncbi:MAG: 50S ribosomal protein L24 [Thermoplasmata archaeon]|nr:50S ribosomal protein L24 [Thermoplasmata archaeon]RLF56512.1 MAG: 50S ribosomal protein L24 [Thermoplasmata archaeon]RLF72245.1 MAG: 50S ribosomal protein L24 [Thermoplasmata archaeon]RLF74387.1 MAG: 50S ribosomal protein L24 [Thermoplasmata archaeon]HDD59880.1 50S ribosomal protein L24 [Euryarchaeota archaeon]
MVRVRSSHPRKQRKFLYNMPKHLARHTFTVRLDPEKYGDVPVKRVVVRKGDTVKIIRGGLKGHEGKVLKVSLKKRRLTVEGATLQKPDGKLVARWIHPSNVVITKLDLSDPLRKEKFKMLKEEGE